MPSRPQVASADSNASCTASSANWKSPTCLIRVARTDARSWWIAQAEAAQANPDEPISELRDRNEHWGDMTAEPGGVDYLETEVAGFPALWAVPEDSQQDRVILALHGRG